MIESSYHPGNSIVHRFDSRAKLLLLVAVSVILFIPQPITVLASYTGLLLLLSIPAAGFRGAFTPLKILLPIIILIFLLTPPFYREGEVMVAYGNYTLLTDQGLQRTLLLVCRFVGLTYAFFIFFRSTPMNKIILTLQWFGIPIRAALVISMSFRFIPLITNTFHRVTEAHRLRGSYQSGMWGWAKLKGILPVLTSVLIKVVKSIPAMSMSLEHRGFGNGIRRTTYHRLRGGRILFTHFTFSVIITLILIVIPLFVV